jgi:hypothetical protein
VARVQRQLRPSVKIERRGRDLDDQQHVVGLRVARAAEIVTPAEQREIGLRPRAGCREAL